MSLKSIATLVMALLKIRSFARANRVSLITRGIVEPRYVLTKYKIRYVKNERRKKLLSKFRLLTKCIIMFISLYKKARIITFKKLFSFGFESINKFKATSKMLESDNSLSLDNSLDANESMNSQLKINNQNSDNIKVISQVKNGLGVNATRFLHINSIAVYEEPREKINSNQRNMGDTLSHIKKIIQPMGSKQNNILPNLEDNATNSQKDGGYLNYDKLHVFERAQSQGKRTHFNINSTFQFSKSKSVSTRQKPKMIHNLTIMNVNWMAQLKSKRKRPRLYTIVLSVIGFIKLMNYVRFKRDKFDYITIAMNPYNYKLGPFTAERGARLARKFKIIAKSVLTFISLYRFIKENSLMLLYNDRNNRDLALLGTRENYITYAIPAISVNKLQDSFTTDRVQPIQKNAPISDASAFHITRNTVKSVYNHNDIRSTSFERTRRAATSLTDFYNDSEHRNHQQSLLGNFMYKKDEDINKNHTISHISNKPITKKHIDNYSEDLNRKYGNHYDFEANINGNERQVSTVSYQHNLKYKKETDEKKRTGSYKAEYTEVKHLSNYIKKI